MRRSSIIGIWRKLSSGSPDSVVQSPRRNSFLQRDLFGLLHACILADKAFDLSGFATGYRIGIAGHFRPPDHLFRQVRSPLPAQIYQLRSGGLRHVRLFERPENLRNIESGQQRTAQHGQFNACGRGFRRSRQLGYGRRTGLGEAHSQPENLTDIARCVFGDGEEGALGIPRAGEINLRGILHALRLQRVDDRSFGNRSGIRIIAGIKGYVPMRGIRRRGNRYGNIRFSRRIG